jgi:hypothetical protein
VGMYERARTPWGSESLQGNAAARQVMSNAIGATTIRSARKKRESDASL